VEGREYDEVENDDVQKDESEKEVGECEAELRQLVEGVARDPGFLGRRISERGSER
jgi:hypothetical protein